jgi:hypothetical protein
MDAQLPTRTLFFSACFSERHEAHGWERKRTRHLLSLSFSESKQLQLDLGRGPISVGGDADVPATGVLPLLRLGEPLHHLSCHLTLHEDEGHRRTVDKSQPLAFPGRTSQRIFIALKKLGSVIPSFIVKGGIERAPKNMSHPLPASFPLRVAGGKTIEIPSIGFGTWAAGEMTFPWNPFS